MKKIKLLLAAAALILGSSGVIAQEAGTYFLYNETTDLFMSRGANYLTKVVAGKFGIAFELIQQSDGVFTMKNVDASLSNNGAKYLGSDLYTDNSTACNYTFAAAASGIGYTVTKGSGFLTAGSSGTALTQESNATDNSVWQLLTREQYYAKLSERADREAVTIATSAGISGVTNQATLFSALSSNYRTIDKTSSIGNANIGDGSSAWTKTQNSDRKPGSFKASGHVFEIWNGCATISQTLSSLPEGIYKLTVQAFYRSGNTDQAGRVGANYSMLPHLFAGDNASLLKSWWDVTDHSINSVSGANSLISADPTFSLVEVYAYVGDAGTLNIGINDLDFHCNGFSPWLICDNFTLTYYTDQVEDADITALVATIPAEETIPAAAYANLTSLQSTLEGSKTIANYKALSAAITAANALVTPYANYNIAKTAVLALDDNSDIYDGDASIDISSAETAVAAATTVEGINAAIALLRSTASTFLAAVTVKDGQFFDITDAFITNSAPWASTEGWTCPVAATPNESARAAEFWNKSGVSISQTMASLPAGYYTLKAQAFARTGCSPIYIFAGTGASFSDYANKQELIKRSNSECSSMAGAGTWFDGGNGWNTLTFQNETAGSFTIGLNDEFEPDGSHGDGHDGWLIWREFKLNYLGTEPISVLADIYADALAAAVAARDNATYVNVQGAERAALVAAIADTPDATSDSYKSKTSALIVATNTFIDPTVVSNWNSYATNYPVEKAKADAISTSIADGITATSSTTAAEAATAVNRLKVAEYNYVVDNYTTAIELGDWNQEGGTTFNYGGQHWSGDNSKGYWEQTSANYQAASWAISFNQTVELPAGSYIFKVAGRHSGSSNMALEVTNADTEEAIGSVNDFPTGGTGKGIATDGTANFTDGTFANGGSGYGFQWRYVPFTLDATTNVKVAITASASTTAQWISFCDYTVQAIPSVEVQTIAYNQAKAAAEAARDDATYTNVQGTDRSNLLSAIAADKGSTVESIDAATAALRTTTATFIAGVASWNEYATAMSVVVPRTLPYASSSKESALETAVTTTVNTASEAATQAPIILTKNRLYVESNALAERVGAVDMTSKIGQANAPASFGEISSWEVTDNNDSHNSDVRSNEQFTQGNGEQGGAYYDGGNLWNASAYTANYKQEVTLNPGKYLLTVTSRASADTKKFELYADENTLEMAKIGGGEGTGVFNRGWNDQSLEFVINDATKAVEIGVNIEQDKVHNWYSFTRFRLVQIEAYNIVVSENTTSTFVATPEPANVTLTRTIKAGTWNTFVVPFDISNTELIAAFGNEVEVAEFSDGGREEAVVLTFTPMLTPAITANKPVLLKTNTAGTSYVFENRSITTGTPTATGTYIDFVGTYEASTTIPAGNYFISGNKLWKSDGTTNIKGTRAYIDATKVPASDVKLFIDDIETSIEEINGEDMEDGLIYNLAGQRIQKMQKGINIVNGKKILY